MTIAASPGQLVIEPDQQFILTNEGPDDLKFVWNHRTWLVAAGTYAVVPFDVVRLYFGDPRSVVGAEQKFEDSDGNKGDIPKREKEIERLSILLGLYPGAEVEIPTHPKIKYVKIQTVDTREEIFCPAHDPEGVNIYGHRESRDGVQNTQTLIRQMQARMEQQQTMIDELRGAAVRDTIEGDGGEETEPGKDGPRFP
jgi:hypothetical protein